MAVQQFNVSAVQGTTFNSVITVKQSDGVTIQNLTGYTAKLEIRSAYSAKTPVYTGTSTGDLVLGGSAGTISWTMSATATGAIPVVANPAGVIPPVQTYYYDLLITSPGGVVTEVCYGSFYLTAVITHS
jgi:hypothetical protein